MTHKLHIVKFVPPFTLYFNVENAQNPGRKHFEKTNIRMCHLVKWSLPFSDFTAPLVWF